ncbi:trichome birefringence-like protein 3 [Tanacetum coccineum]
MEKGEGEENINSILNNFNSKMSHIMNMDGWEDPKVSAMKNNVESSQPKPSFIKVVSGSSDMRQNPKVKFRAMTNSEKVEHSEFVLPVAAVKVVKHKFENSLVGFFVGKKVAFLLVKNYVTNTWAKFGFEKAMSDDDGLFYFKFASSNGLEQVLEQGPWLIINIPLILTKWSPNMSLSKDEVTRVPIWVKFHKVPVVAYSEDGLISADKELKQEVIMAVPNIDKEGEDHTLVKNKVEYEWKPPICLECHVFGHGPDRCPKRVVEIDAPTVEANEDGFIQVVNRKSKGKSISSNPKGNFSGVKVNNAKKTFKWEPVKNPKSQEQKEKHDEQNNGIKLKNLFEKLSDQEDNIFDGNNGETSGGNKAAEFFGDNLTKVSQCNDDTDSEVEETFVESNRGCRIIVGWNVDVVHTMVISQTSQALHVKIFHKATNQTMFCSFIYASNSQIQRRLLWNELGMHKLVVRGSPWVLMGDFNVVLNMEDVYVGASSLNSAMYEFKDCVANIEVIDINLSGLHYTWN